MMENMKRHHVAITLIVFLAVISYVFWTIEQHNEKKEIESSCNIAIVPIYGDIISYSGQQESPVTTSHETLIEVRKAEQNDKILGLLAHIDSTGGDLVAAETIANRFKNSPLPVAALIGGVGASAAYLIATGAKTIIASPFSDVGSIGVTMSYLEKSEKNNKEGLRYVRLISAEFKDYGTENKPLRPSERNILERNLNVWHQYLVELVAKNRGLPIDDVKKLADGSSWPGALALENKLIDQLGDWETSRLWFAKQLNMDPKDVVFCRQE
jgi:protease-4